MEFYKCLLIQDSLTYQMKPSMYRTDDLELEVMLGDLSLSIIAAMHEILLY